MSYSAHEWRAKALLLHVAREIADSEHLDDLIQLRAALTLAMTCIDRTTAIHAEMLAGQIRR